jgi:hypothetical protein
MAGMAIERYRPAVSRTVGTMAFLVAAPILAFAWNGPLYIEVIGVLFGTAGPVFLWSVLRTSIEIGPSSVTTQSTRAPVTFVAGETTTKIRRQTSGPGSG